MSLGKEVMKKTSKKLSDEGKGFSEVEVELDPNKDYICRYIEVLYKNKPIDVMQARLRIPLFIKKIIDERMENTNSFLKEYNKIKPIIPVGE